MRNKKRNNILIIGTSPPPIGGVTIHIKRLIEYLQKENCNFIYVDLRKQKLISVIKYFANSKIIHLHASKPAIRFIFSFFSFFSFKKLIITYHGNLGRFSFLGNVTDYLSILFCSYPILINQISFDKAFKFNHNAQLFSAFIPPENEVMDLKTQKLLSDFRDNKKITFCTNAFDIAYDKNKNEIYGITQLVEIFNSLANKNLIISDPSGNYKTYISSKQNIPSNILFLSYPHDFITVIKASDCLIRATTTDGDSLSVKEALFFRKNVIASDCVLRPQHVILYETNNIELLKSVIVNYKPSTAVLNNLENGAEQLIFLYQKILGN